MRRANIPKRAAGVLLPVSSLPSPYGIGSFGKNARRWVDFLQEAGHTYWQVLPLGPTSFGDSPYQCLSAFAGNPYFIDLDTLCEEGLLKREEYAGINWGSNAQSVDYGLLYREREPVLRKAFARFTEDDSLAAFERDNAFWLKDYALYMAAKAVQSHRSWTEWDVDIRLREPGAVSRYSQELAEDVRYHVFVQYQFYRQWHALHSYAGKKGVKIIGDIPIYVALDSADVWANKALFKLDKDALPTEVAGCPPDCFSKTGQLWGNPLYNWAIMGGDGYDWWIKRMRACFERYDVLRIDHFRGLESYYAIPYGEKTAQNGCWRPGPGMAFVSAIQKAMPKACIIAEDLGFLTDEVRRLLKDSGYPGMKVLQFAFETRDGNEYSPYSYDENCVVYTGTHDNDTMLGWVKNAPPDDVTHAMEYAGIDSRAELPGAMVRLALQSRAALAVVPLQDWLELDSEARVNTPSTIGGQNWCWRMNPKRMDSGLACAMYRMARLYGRTSIRQADLGLNGDAV